MGVTKFVLEETCPKKYPKSEKSGFVTVSVSPKILQLDL